MIEKIKETLITLFIYALIDDMISKSKEIGIDLEVNIRHIDFKKLEEECDKRAKQEQEKKQEESPIFSSEDIVNYFKNMEGKND